ncbi:hypothetical protein [Youxingia wuxianensis]|uniref:Uncharacterized protein n=1 Tax=Youxingia wuxianensis TaxID=2763678 RepID=A0A926EMY3_9FIRM|nr:hypothetical protein [Youxingia wuxianensis]MBC8585551.1 hypothetical protein [Youxingia wuxianensis]
MTLRKLTIGLIAILLLTSSLLVNADTQGKNSLRPALAERGEPMNAK